MSAKKYIWLVEWIPADIGEGFKETFQIDGLCPFYRYDKNSNRQFTMHKNIYKPLDVVSILQRKGKYYVLTILVFTSSCKDF